MTLEAQSLLRKSLYDVCRLQKRQLVGFVLLFFCETICIHWLGSISEIHPLDITRMVVATTLFVLVSMAYVGVAIAWLLSCMTKKVLSAIVLASKT